MSDSAASTPVRSPAIEGWFTTDDQPVLLGNACTTCGTVFFPKAEFFCRNPACDGTEFAERRLSRRGRIWSYTDAEYQPPPPYIPRTDPFEPFAIAAVELEAEQMVILGQVADGVAVGDLQVGQDVELVVEPLWTDAEGEHLIYRWRPVATA